MRVPLHLVQKYSGSGPRYTSYPTAVEFSSAVSNSEWREMVREDSELHTAASGSLYFHIPFCQSLCYFCACNKVITKDKSVSTGYLHAVQRELEVYGEMLHRRPPLEQIHWGGGSPNFLSPDEMVLLHESALKVFGEVLPDADVSIELDPRTTSSDQIKTLAKLGFNRVSLGVQDFNPTVQEAINRIQSFEATSELVADCRAAGFGGVNIDLVYGLTAQTKSSFRDTVEKVLSIRPDRVALYGYAHVTWLQKVQRTLERSHLPAPDERIAIFLDALERFTEAGYEYIGLDHFALPDDELSKALHTGKLNRNFMGYTTHRGARIYAFGPSAISSLPSGFAQNLKEVPGYQSEIAAHGQAIERGLRRTAEDMLRAEVIEDVLCRGGVSYAHYADLLGSFQEHFADAIPALREFEADGILEMSSEGFSLTELGRVFARNVAMCFDEYLAKHRNNKVFSQTV